ARWRARSPRCPASGPSPTRRSGRTTPTTSWPGAGGCAAPGNLCADPGAATGRLAVPLDRTPGTVRGATGHPATETAQPNIATERHSRTHSRRHNRPHDLTHDLTHNRTHNRTQHPNRPTTSCGRDRGDPDRGAEGATTPE